MRKIERTGQFKRDYKRELKGIYRHSLVSDLTAVLKHLLVDKKLSTKYHDHSLIGDWKDHRDCHIKPDQWILQLVRLGSHSELGI